MEPKQLSPGGDRAETGGGWVFPALLAVVLVVAAGLTQLGTNREPQEASDTPAIDWSPTDRPQGETVGLTIDFGNGARQQFDALPWREGMTVEKLMQEAAQFLPGIRFTQHGNGETGFLQSIEGLKSRGTSGRNWTYEVNDRYAETGFCMQKLEPGDRVLWKFAVRE